MEKLWVKFVIGYIRIKTHVLNFLFWPYIHFDFDDLMRKDKQKIGTIKRLPE
jgi:hypothetical protein